MPKKKINVSEAADAAVTPVTEAPAAEPKAAAKTATKTATKAVKAKKEKAGKAEKAEKAAKPAGRRGRPPLTPEVYVELGGTQYNISDVIERAKAAYRVDHKVGVQSCKIYVKPEEAAAYYVINKVTGKLEL